MAAWTSLLHAASGSTSSNIAEKPKRAYLLKLFRFLLFIVGLIILKNDRFQMSGFSYAGIARRAGTASSSADSWSLRLMFLGLMSDGRSSRIATARETT